MAAPRQHPSRRRFLRGSLVAGVVVAVGACGDDDEAAAPPAPRASDPPEAGAPALPPSTTVALLPMFDPLFEPLGQRVTRIGLYDLSEGFDRSATGDHLAIYVEPIDPDGAGWDAARYLEMAVPGMAVVTPYALERWSGLKSVDVCQEPPQAVDASREPPIVTQLLVDREASATIDWETAGLPELRAAAESSDQVVVRVRDDLRRHPLWVAAKPS